MEFYYTVYSMFHPCFTPTRTPRPCVRTCLLLFMLQAIDIGLRKCTHASVHTLTTNYSLLHGRGCTGGAVAPLATSTYTRAGARWRRLLGVCSDGGTLCRQCVSIGTHHCRVQSSRNSQKACQYLPLHTIIMRYLEDLLETVRRDCWRVPFLDRCNSLLRNCRLHI